MALGQDGDFRMTGFRQVMRFGPQDYIGGPGTAMPETWAHPNGSTNSQFPIPPLTFPSLGNPTFTLPGITLPPALPPVLIQPATAGATTTTTITVQDMVAPATFAGINTIQFTTSASPFAVTNPSANIALVNYPNTGGGGGTGTTSLVYGKITSSTKGTNAVWTYQVNIWSAGGATGTTVTAYNLLEKNNTGTVAYGYAVSGAGATQITGTSFYVYPVPNGTDVRMEYTDVYAFPAKEYWFSAPNLIDGAC
jgi:hypothetical protein